MSDSESLDYLQPGFDPGSLTVPRLRSILVTYEVQYPSAAKKGELIDLFNEYVVPRSKKILAQRARAKRSSKGIVDAESSHSSPTDFMDDDLAAPPARSTRSRSPRKSSRLKSEGPETADEMDRRAPLSPRKRSVRSTSRQLQSDTDTDGDVGRTPRAAPCRTVTPHVKLEPPAEEANTGLFAGNRKPDEPDNVFTNDNPFQSGSSPLQAPKTPGNRRRTTGGNDTVVSSKATSAARRRTDGPVLDPPSRKVSRSFEIPVSALKTPVRPAPTTLEAGEEFTPDAQLELAQEEAAHGAVARRRPQPKRQGGINLTTPILVLLVTLLGAYAGWYRQEKIKVGYCGLGQRPTQVLPPEAQEMLPEWANILVEPQCENCPAHAYCFDDFTVSCDDDYILKPHPLSLGGLVPLPPTCEPDGMKARRVQAIADKAVEELRDRRAKYECGEPANEAGQPLDTPSVEEEVLKEIVAEKRSKKLSKQEFDDLWSAAIGEIHNRDEVEVKTEETAQAPDSGAFPNTYLSSTSHARVPYACAARLYVRRGLERYRYGIAAVAFSLAALFASFQYVRVQYRRRKAMAARVPGLVDVVLEKLATQKELAYEGGDQEDPFLFLPNLRDDVLRAEHRLKERERIWERVRAVVEQNSNVRPGQREGRNGEVGRAWEWIGPTNAAAGDGGGRRRTLGGRRSWGGGGADDGCVGVADSPGGGPRTPATSSDAHEDRSSIHRRWQEGGRPAF